jgi:alanyl-tRNA synthetase
VGSSRAASEGDEVEVVLSRSPFYAEGGGQVGDAGIIETPTGRLEVLDTQDVIGGGLRVHRAASSRVRSCPASTSPRASTPSGVRDGTQPLGDARPARDHQGARRRPRAAGRLARAAGPAPLRLPALLRARCRHGRAVEALVNTRVLADPDVRTEVMALEEAKPAGAVANFGDKYGQVVRVVSIGDFSMELCGGTHVATGAGIGTVTIVREESVGSNTRRIEALTGMDAVDVPDARAAGRRGDRAARRRPDRGRARSASRT